MAGRARLTENDLPRYVYTFRREASAAQKRRGSRYGPRRWVFRRNGYTFELPSPLDPSFYVVYGEAMAASAEKRVPGKRRAGGVYSVDWLIGMFRESDIYAGLKPVTRKQKDRLFKNISNDWGEVDIRKITASDLAQELDSIRALTTRNRVRGIFKQLFALAVVRGYVARNVADDVPRARIKSVSTHGWIRPERERFCDRWALGTRERLAFMLMFETVQRSSDVVLMGAGNISGDVIQGRQVKTGTQYRVPISAELAEALAPVRDQSLFIKTAYGVGFTAKGFQKWFGEACKAAGLPDHCRGHGLRTAGCHELAESGATAIELMAISGHKTLAEAQKYIAAANQKTLASAAAGKRARSRV